MSPLDDELRAALHSRAGSLAPAHDPLAGIERRATSIRRRRTTASVVGSALAVAAIAVAVPALLPSPAGPPPQVADSAPPTAVVPAPGPSYALDPASPWPYRGTPLAELGEGFVETVRTEYGVRRGVDASAVQLTPLFGQVYEPSAASELVFLATVDGVDRWGVAVTSEAGPEFPVDEALPSPAQALAAALPGDEVARLLVVTAPDAGRTEYFLDESVEDATALTEIADGVSTGPLEGDPATDSLLVREPDGRELQRLPAPDPVVAGAGSGEQPPPGDEVPAPANVVDWPLRGAVPDELAEQAVQAFADAAGVSRDEVGSRLLYGGQRDGTAYVLLQGWADGDARAFAYARETATGTSASALLPPTSPGPAVLGAVLDGVLLVVPEPRAGQVLYSPDGASEPTPVADQGTEVAVLVEREPGAAGDRVLVLDGDGDPEQPVFRGTVEELLASS